MAKAKRRPLTDIHSGARVGIQRGVRKVYAGIPGEPLPAEHVDLLLALRRREREQAGQQGD